VGHLFFNKSLVNPADYLPISCAFFPIAVLNLNHSQLFKQNGGHPRQNIYCIIHGLCANSSANKLSSLEGLMRHKIFILALVLLIVLVISPISNSLTVSAQENSICGWVESTSDTGAFSPAITIWGTDELLDLPLYQIDLMNIGIPGFFRIDNPVFEDKVSLQGDKFREIISFSRIEKVSSCDTFTQSTPQSTPQSTKANKSKELSPTGFYWPTGKDLSSVHNNYLASSCNGKSDYKTPNNYHIGVDISASLGKPVYAVADGEVYDISNRADSGWGFTEEVPNAAVLIKHKLSDGSSFIAIYGHLQNSSLTVSKTGEKKFVKANQIIGTIGDYDVTHLHFGIFVGDSIKDRGHYGMLPCPKSGSIIEKNGTVAPINWIKTKYPKNDSEGSSVCDETWRDLRQVDPVLVPVLLNTELPSGNLTLSSAGGFSNTECADFKFRGYGINIMQHSQMVGDINITQYASREIALVNSGLRNGNNEIWHKEEGKWFFNTAACESGIEFNLDENMKTALEVIVSNNVDNFRKAACDLPSYSSSGGENTTGQIKIIPNSESNITNSPAPAGESAEASTISPLVGTWKGSVLNKDFKMNITVTIEEGCQLNQVCGGFDISTISCTGKFTWIGMDQGMYQFQASDHSQGCGDGKAKDYLSPQADGTLLYISRGDYGETKGFLKKNP